MFKGKRYRKPNYLEVDEIFFDSYQLAQKDLRWGNRIALAVSESAIRKLGYLFFGFIAIVFLRELQLVFFKGEQYSAAAEANYIKELWDRAPRGIVYDSNGQALVKNTLSFNLVMIPAELPRQKEEQEKIVTALAQLLKEDVVLVKERFKDIDRFSFRPVLVLADLNHDEFLAMETKLENLPGLRLEEDFKREYQGRGAFSHVLGYTGRVSSKDVKQNPSYLLTDVIGKNGLEFQYEEFLKGDHGVTKLESYAYGGIGRPVASREAVPGHNLNLFLDANLQSKLTEVLINHVASAGLSRAAAVAIDPKSGGVLALQSLPTFDNNIFGSRLSQETFKNLFESKSQPMFNRAIGGLYPPGSTIKPFLGVAALEEGIVDDTTTIFDSGVITVGTQDFRGWKPLGVVDVYKAIAMSSNIFFYTVGGGHGSIKGLGPERIGEYLKRFGFSKLSQIDLPGESAGFIPDPAWKRLAKREGWFVGDTYNMSIGQGFMQVTPLQLALATAAVANNGTIFKPRMIKSISKTDGESVKIIEPEVLSKSFVDAKALAIIRKAMHETVVSGSARSLAHLPGSAGGKTGTAQTGVGNNTHAWFTVFAPYEDPKIALAIVVENGGEGSSIAVPIAREILEWYMAR